MVIGRPNVFEETRAQVAQLVEQWIENPRVSSSNLDPGIIGLCFWIKLFTRFF